MFLLHEDVIRQYKQLQSDLLKVAVSHCFDRNQEEVDVSGDTVVVEVAYLMADRTNSYYLK